MAQVRKEKPDLIWIDGNGYNKRASIAAGMIFKGPHVHPSLPGDEIISSPDSGVGQAPDQRGPG